MPQHQQNHVAMRLLALSAVSASALAVAAAAQAQTQSITDTITVTAQKREQNAQNVGIAISAYSGEQLQELGVEESFDIATFTPGVHISGNLAGQNTQFTIRGVTQNDFNDIVEAPNAVYLDDGYIAVAQAQTFAAFDVDRVEILKGPQGTLFGRNATGGLVHYISAQPSLDGYEAYADVTYGRFDSPAHADQVRVESAINVPLSDDVAFRAAILYNYHEPYLKNLYPDGAVGNPTGPFGVAPGPDAGADLGDDDTLAGRFQLLFEPSADFRVRAAFNGSRSRVATGPYQSKPTIGVFDANNELIDVIDVAPDETRLTIAADGSDFGSDTDNDGTFGLPEFPGAPTARPVPGGDFFGYIDPDGEDFTFSSDFAFADSGKVDSWGGNLKVEKDLSDRVVLTAISDYKKYDKLLFIDVDSAPVNQSANYAAVDAYSFTQEVRLNGATDRSDWVLGFYYLRIDSESDNGLKFPVGSIVPGPFDLGADARLKTNSYSVFGQYEFDITNNLRLIGGLRGIRENKDYVFSQNLYFGTDSRTIHQGAPVNIGPVIGPNGPEAFTADTGDWHWAGKIQLDLQATEDLLLYAGVNRGVKAASFNAQLAGGLPVPTSAIPYDREVLVSYEGGFKATLLDGLARLNGSLYYYDYTDYQAFLFTGVSGVVVNADATNVGGEVELQATLAEGFDLIANVAAFDAKVKDVPLRVGGPIRRDVDPTYAPELQISVTGRYEWPLFGGYASVLGAYSYSDEYFYNLRNFGADKFDSYSLLNSRLGWRSGNGGLSLAFTVNNITDERIGIQGFDLATLCGCNEISFQPPRWYGFTLRIER